MIKRISNDSVWFANLYRERMKNHALDSSRVSFSTFTRQQMIIFRENLGYIVASATSVSNGVQGLRVVIQSERTPDYLEQRAEAFINHIEVSKVNSLTMTYETMHLSGCILFD